MIANNPYRDNKRFIRFQSITEESLTWTLDSTAATANFKTMVLDTKWLPVVGTNSLIEAAFNEYERKMLTKISWRASNFRVFLATQLYQPAISTAGPPAINAPAQQTFDISQKPYWKVWRYNPPSSGMALLPTTSEERATSTIIGYPKSSMSGQMHLGKARQMNWYQGTYSALTTDFSNLSKFLQHYMRTGLRGDVSNVVPPAVPPLTAYPTLDIQLMPDDPYPVSTISNIQLLKATLSVEFDLTIWTTFLCSKMTQS